MTTLIQLGQGRLNCTVTTIDHQNHRLHAGDRSQGHRHLGDVFNLIMEDVGMRGDEVTDARQHRPVAGGPRVRQQRDQGHDVPT